MTSSPLRKSVCLLLAYLAVAYADLDDCVGLVIQSATFMTGGGLMVADIGKYCHGGGCDSCEKAVEKVIDTWTNGITQLEAAVNVCGGPKTSCSQGVVFAVNQLNGLVKSVRALKHGASAGKVQNLGYGLNNAAAAMTDSIASCEPANDPSPVNVGVGHCVGRTLDSATQLVAAGLMIDKAKDTCPTNADECDRDAGFILNAVSQTSNYAFDAVDQCGGQGSQCGMSVTHASMTLSSAMATAGQLKVAANHATHGVTNGVLTFVDDLGEALSTASSQLDDAGHNCGTSNSVVGTGDCVGDAFSMTTYLVTGSLSIAVAAEDCAKVGVSGKINHKRLADCATEVSYAISKYADVANAIMWATADCRKKPLFKTNCGSDIAGAVKAIATAAAASATVAEFSCGHDLSKLGAKLKTLGTSLRSVSSVLGAAMHNCDRQATTTEESFTGPKVIVSPGNGIKPLPGGPGQLKTAHIVEKWGLQAKKWYRGGWHNVDSHYKKDIGKYMVPAGAAVGLALVSLVALSARKFRRRSNDEATIQLHSNDDEEADLMEE